MEQKNKNQVIEQFGEPKLKTYIDGFFLMGFADQNGEIVIPAQWHVNPVNFSEGLAPVKSVCNNKYGYIDTTGSVVIPYVWESAGSFSKGMASVKDSNEKWGCIDQTGKLVIPCKWYDVIVYVRGIAKVMNGRKRYGLIDRTGEIIVPCKYKKITPFRGNLAIVRDSNNKCGIVDTTGKVVVPCRWMDIKHFQEGYSVARDAEGKMVPALAAGGHYDPMKTGKHAGPEKGGHKGDLPLIMADKNGRAEIDFYQKNLTLDEIKNRSIMIHAGGDNYQDQPLPLGGGGARIGCGVIK